MLAALVLLLALALVAGWELFCLANLVRADKVRFLPKWVWAVACLIQIPLGGVLYLLLGRVWSGDGGEQGAELDRVIVARPYTPSLYGADEDDPVERRPVVVLDRV